MLKRFIVLGDLHCGHAGGLTPPGWQMKEERSPYFAAIESEMWRKYRALVRKYTKGFKGKLIVVCNGDAIDGNHNIGECITTDRSEQVDMAVKCLQPWNASQYIFTYGTPFHTGKEEDWERELANKFEGDIAPFQYVDVDGLTFFFRHKIGRSGVPYGRNTAVAKVKVWNELMAANAEVPRADILCFSHVHYHSYCGGADWMGMTLPALQTVSSYGGRECDGPVDWGITCFDVNKGVLQSWCSDITTINTTKPEVLTA